MSEKWVPASSETFDPKRRRDYTPPREEADVDDCLCPACRLLSELRRARVQNAGLAVRCQRMMRECASKDEALEAVGGELARLRGENRALRMRLCSAGAALLLFGLGGAILVGWIVGGLRQ